MSDADKRERALWLADKLVGDYGSEAAQLLRYFASLTPSADVSIIEELREQIASLHDRLAQETHARQLEQERNDRLAQSATEAIPEGCTPTDAMVLREANHQLAEENHNLRRCLRFYANGDHIAGFSTWEGPSGDDNWLCPPSKEFGDDEYSRKWGYLKFLDTLDEHMIEDGSVARGTLITGKFECEADEEPKLVKGEPEYEIEQQAKNATDATTDRSVTRDA